MAFSRAGCGVQTPLKITEGVLWVCVRGLRDVCVPGSLLTPGRLLPELQMPRVAHVWPVLPLRLPDRVNGLSPLPSLEQPALQLAAVVIVALAPWILTRICDSSPREPRL